MTYIIFAITLFFILLSLNVSRHYRLWKESQKWPIVGKRIPINHKEENKIRLVIFSPVVFLFMLGVNGLNKQSVLMHWLSLAGLLIICSGMVACSFWFIFDGLFNRKRGFKWYFEGTVDFDEAKSDNILRGMTVAQKLLLQVGSSVGFILLYLFYLIHF